MFLALRSTSCQTEDLEGGTSVPLALGNSNYPSIPSVRGRSRQRRICATRVAALEVQVLHHRVLQPCSPKPYVLL